MLAFLLQTGNNEDADVDCGPDSRQVFLHHSLSSGVCHDLCTDWKRPLQQCEVWRGAGKVSLEYPACMRVSVHVFMLSIDLEFECRVSVSAC